MISAFDEVRKNKRNSTLLLVFYIIIIAFIGGFAGFVLNPGSTGVSGIDLIGSWFFTGMILAAVISTIYSLIAIKYGSKIVIASTGAREVTKKEFPFLFNTVEGLTISAGLKKIPKCYVIESKALNAYATGPNPENSAIVVTTGLLEKMKRQELEGVIAHELSHIKNYDIRFMMLITVLVGIVTIFGQIALRVAFFSRGTRNSENSGQLKIALFLIGIVFMIAGPLFGKIVQLMISRKREYLADASGAIMTRYPEGLASALEKIKKDSNYEIKKVSSATEHLFISSPLRSRNINNIFSTHPPIEERIKKLRAM